MKSCFFVLLRNYNTLYIQYRSPVAFGFPPLRRSLLIGPLPHPLVLGS